MRTRIKICGITRAQDAEAAAALGVDALGFVLVPRSRRYVCAQTAARIARALPPFVASVALFMDADAQTVRDTLQIFTPSLLQFHGSESAEFCAGFGLPYIKAVAMRDPVDLAEESVRYADARALLLDGHAPGQMGGSGEAFDWHAARAPQQPLILAGGLNADNVGTGIRVLKPFAVDVSSGVEHEPGIKDLAKMRAFVEAVRRTDGE